MIHVREWREYRGMSRRRLAAAAAISLPFLSEIETGKKDCSVAVLKRLSAALNVNPGTLIGYQCGTFAAQVHESALDHLRDLMIVVRP